MKVLLVRGWRMPKYTIGHWIVDGNVMCHSLEDKDRGLTQSMTKAQMDAIKVYGETAIPTGHYKIKMTWSKKYGKMMPEVLNVKSHSGVRVHAGNKPEDTLGCILLGNAPDPENKAWVSNSKVCVDKFVEMLNSVGGECDFDVI